MTDLSRRRFLQGVSAAAGAALVVGQSASTRAQRESAAALARFGTPGDADFPKVGGNLGNQNYSALATVRADNVSDLGGAWVTRIGDDDGAGANSQSTAVAVDGVLYVESAQGHVLAIDGATGTIKWRFEPTGGPLVRRGVAVGDGKVFTIVRTNRLVALDRESGAVVWDRQYDDFGNIAKVAVVYCAGTLLVGTNDGPRGAALACDAVDGRLRWHFWGAPGPGERGHETWEGDSWQTGGATPWMHPAVDPELGLVYWTFGNARGSNGPLDGSGRGGANLFANSLVALDLETGAYRWHFQSVHHDIWDMDNVMAPVLVDAEIDGQTRQLVVYGSKTGMYYILDRVDGSAPLGIDEVAVPQEPRQKTWPTQPIPRQGPWMETDLMAEPLGSAVPGHPARAVPNYEVGPLFTPHWDTPVLRMPGTGGGADWAHQAYSPRTGLVYAGFGYVASAAVRQGVGVGYRPPGEYMTGGIVAVDPATNEVRWRRPMPWSLAHGNGILATAADLLFIGQPDGYLLALDARDARELWRFQTGAAISASPIAYEIDGEQYISVLTGGTSLPYGASIPRGDTLWAFRIGGREPEAPAPPPPDVRRAVSGVPVEGRIVDNRVVLARTFDAETGQVSADESTAGNAMAPTHLRVPVGTTVTFHNPADNVQRHGATQFFEGLFDVTLAPGESFRYTFTERGEYFFNDTFDPRPTGKIEVY